MRTGCIAAAVVLVIVIAIAGYFAYQMIGENFDTPHDLAVYDNMDSLVMQIRSQAPAPPDTAHLTQERLDFFIGSLDSLDVGWRELAHVFDSLQTGGKDAKEFDLWTSPVIIREVVRTPLITRRALVSYLNARNISWAEYLWAKERTVAASGITHQQCDSAMNAVVHDYFKQEMPNLKPSKDEDAELLFKRADQLRASGSIDSAEIAMVAPLRPTLLSKGIPALMGMEIPGDGEETSIHFNTSMHPPGK